jgi:DNA-3-methyladenine glycosylase
VSAKRAVRDSIPIAAPKRPPQTGEPLGRSFFDRPADQLAPALLGTIMVRRSDDGRVLRARLVETEAYLGPRDLAAHSSKGRTNRTDVMFGPPGRAYVYFIYGMYQMFNVVAGPEGSAHAVLVRGAEPLDGWDADLTGPGKLARAFGITAADNRKDLTGTSDIVFYADASHQPRTIRTKRIGVDYAKHWQHRLLRHIDVRSPIAKKLKR